MYKFCFLFILVFPVLIACDNEKTCPGYDSTNVAFIPYEQNDGLFFKSGVDNLELSVTSLYNTNNYDMDADCDCNCEQYRYFNTSYDSLHYYGLRGMHNDSEKKYSFYVMRYGYDDNGKFGSMNVDYFEILDDKVSSNLVSTYEMAEETYNNVIVLELDTTINSEFIDVWKIAVSEGKGIIQMEEFKTDRVWEYYSE